VFITRAYERENSSQQNVRRGMKKIAIVGAHGVGKTTLVNCLADFTRKKLHPTEIVSEVVRQCPFPIHEGQTMDSTTWIVCSQILAELKAALTCPTYIFCDRSVYDPLVYLLYAKPEIFSQELMEFVESYARTYDKIFLIRPSQKEIVEDGFRSKDKEFQYGINSIFTSWILGKCTILESKEIFEGNNTNLCAHILGSIE